MEKRDHLFRRSITIDTYELGENEIVVEGRLQDERFFPFVIYSANITREAGVIHDLTVTMTLAIPEMKIKEITSEMPTVPLEGCREIKNAVKRLENLYIKPGFTGEIKQLLGKTQGCLHMMNLVLAMASAAVQGMWAYYTRKRNDGKTRLPQTIDGSMMFDSCWMWRKEGPIAQRFRERFGKGGRDER
ncbi:MAG: DUF2889 domain-containing protein [Syntrophales bacterium]|nr:DUF2889 domain-containing protein [Syntrophales bacterium]